MSLERYIELLQQLITMVDPKDEDQVLNAKNILKNLLELAETSHKANNHVIRAIIISRRIFDNLLQHKDDFAGIPGDYSGNAAKRHRLTMTVSPHC